MNQSISLEYPPNSYKISAVGKKESNGKAAKGCQENLRKSEKTTGVNQYLYFLFLNCSEFERPDIIKIDS